MDVSKFEHALTAIYPSSCRDWGVIIINKDLSVTEHVNSIVYEAHQRANASMLWKFESRNVNSLTPCLYTVRQKNAPLFVWNNLIKQRSSMPIFANSYLNVFVTKRCKNYTFTDQVFLQYEIQ